MTRLDNNICEGVLVEEPTTISWIDARTRSKCHLLSEVRHDLRALIVLEVTSIQIKACINKIVSEIETHRNIL